MKAIQGSLRYDVSLGMRLLRAIPIVLVYFGIAVICFLFLPGKARDIPLEYWRVALPVVDDPLHPRFDLRTFCLSQNAIRGGQSSRQAQVSATDVFRDPHFWRKARSVAKHVEFGADRSSVDPE